MNICGNIFAKDPHGKEERYIWHGNTVKLFCDKYKVRNIFKKISTLKIRYPVIHYNATSHSNGNEDYRNVSANKVSTDSWLTRGIYRLNLNEAGCLERMGHYG